MKPASILFILLLSMAGLSAQKAPVNPYAAIDKKALQLPDSLTKTTSDIAAYISTNFTTEKEKARAIFIWIASNIQYDIENMFAINFYETKENKIAKPLQTRKGICENYAALYNDVCSKTGIKSFVIEGYTKQNGFVEYIPHAWCVAQIDTSWYVFDATWGSGYVSEGKFYRKIDNSYFMANPAIRLKSHMPFDFLWQFVNYPISNQEFYEGKIQQVQTKPFFNFNDSIAAYEKQEPLEQLKATAVRIEKNGIKNSLIFDRLQHIRLEIENMKSQREYEKQKKVNDLYNSAVSDYNEATNRFNEFIQYRNDQFTPKKPDPEIRSMIEVTDSFTNQAKLKLSQIKEPDPTIVSVILQMTKAINDLSTHIKEQQDWLKEYFSKGNAGRKSMFYKYTWFGIPLN